MYALEMKQITKSFSGVQALKKVDLQVEHSEIHALLGENGAGKSTLVKILAGVHQSDKGEIFIDGQKVTIQNVLQAQKLGIGIVFQELSLAPNLSVSSNIFALNEMTSYGFINDKKMNQETKNILEELGVDDILPTDIVGDLSLAKQQMVEIAKVLVKKPKIIIMDEPTSALSEKETKRLFDVLKRIKDRGDSIIYISHRMEELFEITDKITVLRDGEYIGTVKTKQSNSQDLVKMMVGRSFDNFFPRKDFKYTSDDSLLKVEGYTKAGKYKDINFDLRPGEILGFYGLMGSGRTEIVEGIFGILKKDRGRLYINNNEVNIRKPSDAIQNKIAYVTEDRKNKGLVLDFSVKENISMASLDQIVAKNRLINEKIEGKLADKKIKELSIKTPSFEQFAKFLSGGNQQKVVLSKWFLISPEILILDEPTRGIDIGAKYDIYQMMIELAKEGVGIILISSELPEVLNMSDRVLVVNDHRIIGEVDPKTSSQEEIMHMIIGGGR